MNKSLRLDSPAPDHLKHDAARTTSGSSFREDFPQLTQHRAPCELTQGAHSAEHEKWGCRMKGEGCPSLDRSLQQEQARGSSSGEDTGPYGQCALSALNLEPSQLSWLHHAKAWRSDFDTQPTWR